MKCPVCGRKMKIHIYPGSACCASSCECGVTTDTYYRIRNEVVSIADFDIPERYQPTEKQRKTVRMIQNVLHIRPPVYTKKAYQEFIGTFLPYIRKKLNDEPYWWVKFEKEKLPNYYVRAWEDDETIPDEVTDINYHVVVF